MPKDIVEMNSNEDDQDMKETRLDRNDNRVLDSQSGLYQNINC